MFLQCILFFVVSILLLIVCVLLHVVFFRSPIPQHPRSRSQPSLSPSKGSRLPAIPRTLEEVLRLSPRQFEIFAAAVLIALGDGHSFLQHCGQSGDEGVDVKLLNIYHHKVIVQCKLYAQDNHIGQSELRDFWGSISYHNAVYGFFVTTSTFTSSAHRLISASGGRIRPVDGRRLQDILKDRPHEVALAFLDVQRMLG